MSIFGTSKPSIFEPTSFIDINSYAYSSTYVEITTNGVHGLSSGDVVLIQGVTFPPGDPEINTIWTVTVTSTTKFKIFPTADPSGATYSGGNLRLGYQFFNSLIDYDLVQPDQLNYRSVLTGVRSNTHLGDYGSFKITERLWQNDRTAYVPKDKFLKLYAFYHTDVWLLPHSGTAVKNSSNTIIPCYFKTFKPFYFKNYINYDAVTCEFETNKYYDITKLLT